MANNLYTVSAIGATFNQNKIMISLFNSTGSGKILSVRKIWVLNNQSVAVAGVLTNMQLWSTNSTGGGAALTPVKHNSGIANLPSTIIASTGSTNNLVSLFRRFIWSSDEPVATEVNSDVFQLKPKWNILYELPITNTQLEPIVLNEGQGIAIRFVTASSVGQADFFIEFTTN